MTPTTMIRFAAVLGALGVACGAFGAHGLEGKIPEHDLGTWNKAVHYQLWHALALLLVAALHDRLKKASAAALCFAIGTAVFSGTLYLLVLTGVKALGAITPIGGVLMIAGWALLLAKKTISTPIAAGAAT